MCSEWIAWSILPSEQGSLVKWALELSLPLHLESEICGILMLSISEYWRMVDSYLVCCFLLQTLAVQREATVLWFCLCQHVFHFMSHWQKYAGVLLHSTATCCVWNTDYILLPVRNGAKASCAVFSSPAAPWLKKSRGFYVALELELATCCNCPLKQYFRVVFS